MQPPTGMTRAQANAFRSTCTACHQRKVKCDAHDRGYPCSRCAKNGCADDCRQHRKNKRVSRARQAQAAAPRVDSQSPRNPKPLSPAVPAPSPAEQIIVDVDRAVATPGSLFLQTVIAQDAQGHEEAGQHTQPPVRNDPVTPPQPPYTSSDAGTAGSTTAASTPAVLPTHGVDGEYRKYLVEFIDQPQLAQRPIDKTARILYVGSELSNIHVLLRQRMATAGRQEETHGTSESRTQGTEEGTRQTSQARTTESDTQAQTRFQSYAVHYPTNRIAKPSAGVGGLAADGVPLEAFQLPSKRTVDQLLAAYLQHINPGFPVVDGRLLMRQYRARDPQNPPSLLLLQAMLVAGAHVFYRNDHDERTAHKAVFFRRAKMLLDARVERNRDTVVQAALLLTWHADGPEDVAANAWHWVGLAARTATGLGMHRDAEGSTLVPHNKRMWRRVWWLLVACDVLVAVQYGRPAALHLDDTNVRPLVASDFADCGEGTRVDYVQHLVQLCIVLSTHVLRRQFQSSPARARAAALRRTDEALASWYLHLPPSLQLGGDYADAVVPSSLSPPLSSINVWTASLHLAYNTALLLLHRPAPSCPSSSPDDVEICTSAALTIQQIFQAICSSGQAVYLWSSAVNSLFTALIQLSGDVQRSTSSSTTDLTGNPLLAVAALRRYDAALASLRQLAVYWPNAQAVVQFFEQSARTTPVTTRHHTQSHALPTLQPTQTGADASDRTGNATPVSHEATMKVSDNIEVNTMASTANTVDEAAARDISPYASSVDMHMLDPVVDSTLPDGPDMAHHMLTRLMAASRQTMPLDASIDPWNAVGTVSSDWQHIQWQQPELTDDFLFSF